MPPEPPGGMYLEVTFLTPLTIVSVNSVCPPLPSDSVHDLDDDDPPDDEDDDDDDDCGLLNTNNPKR